MIIERTEHPDWLSNAYLLADGPGGHGVLIDSNGISEPLLSAAREQDVTITHVLLTHQHADHIVASRDEADALGVPLVAHRKTAAAVDFGVDIELEDDGTVDAAGQTLRFLFTPGHCADHCAILAGEHCFTADVLFKGTVGGTLNGGPQGFSQLKGSIMDTLMALPHETTIHPGHVGASTLAAEWESNPFVRIWRGLDPEGEEACEVGGEPATLVLWAPDYDGGNKAWVRDPDNGDRIVGGSMVSR